MAVALNDAIYMFIQFLMVLSVWSYLYKDNIFSRASAQIVVAISTVHFFMNNLQNVWLRAVDPIFSQGKWLNIIPITLGLLLYTRLIKGKGWISSYSYSVALGIGTGAIFTTYIATSIIGLIITTAAKPWEKPDIISQISGVILIIGCIFSLSYWLFTVEYKGPLAWVLKIGRWFLMCSIGLLYAQDVLWAQSLFVGATEMVLKFIRVVLLGMPV